MTQTFPVYLVGAGPGDPDLLTVKALRVLTEATAVVYDRLIPDAILALIPPHASRYFAGKSCKQHVMTQDEINALLVKLAHSGARVVRLKGGDPFIFGRGGEEAEYMSLHGIVWEVIPGITSASGCAAAAAIPLTHRGLATSVHFITGHSKHPDAELNWQKFADPTVTLVVYMGLANAGIIARRLIEHGLPPSLPVMVIEQGTTPRERILRSTLLNLEQDLLYAGIEPPGLMIIGQVAGLELRHASSNN